MRKHTIFFLVITMVSAMLVLGVGFRGYASEIKGISPEIHAEQMQNSLNQFSANIVKYSDNSHEGTGYQKGRIVTIVVLLMIIYSFGIYLAVKNNLLEVKKVKIQESKYDLQEVRQ